MALKAAAQHQRQDGSDVRSEGGRGTDSPAVKPTIPPDTQTLPTGDRGCDDDKK